MEDFRTDALLEIKSRILRDRTILGIESFMWNNNGPISKTTVPTIYMFEGRDVIEKYNQGSPLGYPARRHLEINIEIVAKNDREAAGVKALLQKVKRTIFCDRTGDGEDIKWTPNAVVAKNSFIRELRIKGPGTYEVPELVGIKLVIGLWYTDNGFL
jgi:hypothetical protein